jgi:branched-chain amino acid transport system substrate-binding protein
MAGGPNAAPAANAKLKAQPAREDRMFKHAIAAAALSAMLWLPAQAEMNGATRIGVLNDMSSVYSDFQGPGSVVAAQMAAEEFAKGSKR